MKLDLKKLERFAQSNGANPQADKRDLPDVHYDQQGNYYEPTSGGNYIKVTERAVREKLARNGMSPFLPKDSDGHLLAFTSPVDDVLAEIRDRQNVAYAGSLAGKQPGRYEIN